MAKHVEIPFSIVRDHPAVRHLHSGAVGAYWLLMCAALWDGVDLAEQNDSSLAFIGRQHMTAWRRIRKQVMKALAETMVKMRKEYSRRVASHNAFIENSKRGWLKAYAVRMAKKKSINAGAELVELTNPVAQLFQPRKINEYKSLAVDTAARKAAATRHKSASKTGTLTE